MRTARDPAAEALDRAPIVQTLTAEQRAELDQIVEDIRLGRMKLVAHEDVPGWLEDARGVTSTRQTR